MARLLRVSVRSTLYDQELVTVLHVAGTQQLADDDNLDLDGEMATELWNRIGPTYKGMLPSLGSVVDLTVADEADPLDPHLERRAYTKSINEGGTRGVPNTDLPLGVCAVLGWSSDRYGRRFRGRTFCPPALSEVEMESRTFRTGTGSYIEKCDAFGAAWPGDIEYGIAPLKVLSPCAYSRTARAEGDPAYWAKLTGHRVRTTPHWLRARQR